MNQIKEIKVRVFGELVANPDTEDEIVVSAGYHDALEFNGCVLLRLSNCGDFLNLKEFMGWERDDLDEVLKANGHLCRSDLM